MQIRCKKKIKMFSIQLCLTWKSMPISAMPQEKSSWIHTPQQKKEKMFFYVFLLGFGAHSEFDYFNPFSFDLHHQDHHHHRWEIGASIYGMIFVSFDLYAWVWACESEKTQNMNAHKSPSLLPPLSLLSSFDYCYYHSHLSKDVIKFDGVLIIIIPYSLSRPLSHPHDEFVVVFVHEIRKCADISVFGVFVIDVVFVLVYIYHMNCGCWLVVMVTVTWVCVCLIAVEPNEIGRTEI